MLHHEVGLLGDFIFNKISELGEFIKGSSSIGLTS